MSGDVGFRTHVEGFRAYAKESALQRMIDRRVGEGLFELSIKVLAYVKEICDSGVIGKRAGGWGLFKVLGACSTFCTKVLAQG